MLGELFVVLTKRVGKPLPKEKASTIVLALADSSKWNEINYTHLTVKCALEDMRAINASFWEILIAETMRDAGVTKIYTENEKDFKKIPWIRIENPIKSL